jgi:hypothetical protein
MEETINANKILVENLQRWKPFGRYRYRWEP